MIPELRYELLFFFTRDELEHLQPLSQALLHMIVKGSKVLALRPIDRIVMNDVYFRSKDKIKICVEYAAEPNYEASVLDGDFEQTFLRLQNTCIKEFRVGIRDSPFLRYWKAQEAAAFVVVIIDFNLPKTTDYGLFDTIVNHLRPTTAHEVLVDDSSWHENGYNSDELELLTRASFLNNLRTCQLTVCDDDGFPPPTFFLKEPGYTNYELWCADSNVADGIDAFIESFMRDGCANKKLESVRIEWDDDVDQPSVAPKQLKKPTKTDLPLPNKVTAWVRHAIHPATQCELHSFANKKQWMRMDVFKWSVEYLRDRLVTRHTLFCRVMDI
ncbi:hypothetical protein AAVH_17673 [Aphelenchoides avenae]|nr:hypothetical protein AAVH_17673 [Aphelenchus avenae]